MKKVSEEMFRSLGEMLKGKTHEEAREAIIASIQEDLITQSLLGSGLTSEEAECLRKRPRMYMDLQVVRTLHPDWGPWDYEDEYFHSLIGRSPMIAQNILSEWPELMGCDVRIDRIAPPEALRRHGEAAVESYVASMSREGASALAMGSLWRVILCPMVVRGFVDTVTAKLYKDEPEMGYMLYELISSAFSGVSIDLDLAAYAAVMNYDAAMKAMQSDDGMILAAGEGYVIVHMLPPEEEGGLPVMSLSMGRGKV